MTETPADQRTDMEILHAAGIEGSDATTSLRILAKHDVWVPAVIGHDALRAATVLSKAGRGKPLTETPEETRTRILAASPETKSWEYDLALALGYEPESWEGMWKLKPSPFGFEDGKVTAREVVYMPGTTQPDIDEQGEVLTQMVKHDLPAGWHVASEAPLGSAEERHTFISPAVAASLENFRQRWIM
jgi:hypothetical protein